MTSPEKVNRRVGDLASDLFGRATPATPPPPSWGQANIVQVRGRMDWSMDRPAAHRLVDGDINRTRDLQNASYGVLDGAGEATVAALDAHRAAAPKPHPFARTHSSAYQRGLDPHDRLMWTFGTSRPMKDAISPMHTDEPHGPAYGSLRGRQDGPGAEEVEGLCWVRVQGIARGPIDRVMGELCDGVALVAEEADEAPLVATRVPVDPVKGEGKGVAFLAFACADAAGAGAAIHELKIRGLTVMPVTYAKMTAEI